MYLQKLEIQGFKSFANKTVLEFTPKSRGGKSITAIVGPNGSGKSNVADAVRWVLGEQSLKLLRGKKSEDVIFSGSPKKPRMGFAEVSLYLNNEDGFAPIDFREVVLTRRVYRSGESEYLINKSKVRLSDVLLLLAQSNFGQKTYAIIGQGMVDAMLLATPLERKEFFDEATGVEQYQMKRNQALNKLKASEENLRQAEALFIEIEPRVKSLTRQMKRLAERSQVEAELKDLQKKYYSHLWKELNGKMKTEETRLAPLLEKKKKLEGEVGEAEEKLKTMEKEQPTSDLFRKLQSEYEKLFEEKNRLRERDMVIKNKMAFAQHAELVRPMAMPASEIEMTVEDLFKSYDNFVKKLAKAEDANSLADLKKEAEDLRKEFAAFFAKLKREPAKKEAAKVDPSLPKELEKIVGEIEKINRALTEVQVKIENFNREQEAERRSFFELQRNLQLKQHELYLLSSEINAIQVEGAGAAARREDLEREIRQELGDPRELGEPAGFESDWHEKIFKFKHQLELIGGIDPETEKEYKESSERYEFLKTQIADLRGAIDSLMKVIGELDGIIKKQFDAAFHKINDEFGKYFKILFGGGKAQLILKKEIKVDEEEIEAAEGEAAEEPEKEKKKKGEEFIAGIEVEATPPGKRLKGIGMLSGGERALTSIALLSAIISNNPAPFVVLDEVDAALDESNSIRFANVFDELTDKTQFILITHNRATMQKASILYGVTMEADGVSRLLSLNLEQAERAVGAA
ncbi:AAA family ATPase [Patescibacteria group bacterium]|nr:AAA family ATPase [Patescibacteria group bacterium]